MLFVEENLGQQALLTQGTPHSLRARDSATTPKAGNQKDGRLKTEREK